jgi:lysozyme
MVSAVEAYPVTAERRALLNTLRYAEGTWIGGREEGYRVIYGGGRVDRLDRHPEITVQRTYVSAAAGAYQFLPTTWKEAANRLGLSDFGPQSQDQAALYLIKKRGALASFDAQGLTHEVLARLAPEWASLPAQHGGSYYGQPVKTVAELKRFYSVELQRLQQT